MNMKIGFGILFGVPTLLLAFIYYYLDVNNYWQLFLFSSMVMIAYMPGMLMLHFVYTYKIRKKLHDDLRDFSDEE